MSSARIPWRGLVWLLLAGTALAVLPCATASAQAAAGHSSSASATPADPAKLFQRGQDALARGQLDEAERDFRGVLQLDHLSGAAYGNLGVVYMRRKQWAKALDTLRRAEHLSVMPQVAGIRLNIGLAYFRQNEFLKAIPPFVAVVRDQPDAAQPRYLLGLCYFFADRWADAANTLEPLWAQESAHLPFLYVLSNAAHRAGKKELDGRATAQLIKLGDGTPAYRLFVGKYYLNVEQYDAALAEFQAAAEAAPSLPFVHFDLGLTYLKRQDLAHARDEFLKDAALEPDLALNYDELGDVYWLMQDDANAEKNYREALRRDSRLVNSHLGLAKIYQRQGKFAPALAEAEAAGKLDPERVDVHYVHGRLLQRLGRSVEARKELDAAVRIENEHRADPVKPGESGMAPSPELLQGSQ